MHDDGVGLTIDGLSEELPRGRYTRDDLLDLGAPLDLEAVGAVILRPLGLEQLIELGYQLQEIHGPMVSQSGRR
mgnify:CR=1 FL=1